jgi:CheY-like chemotaxis protein
METAATLAGGIAHKVNNLMTAVLGYAELLKSQLTDHPEAIEILTTISNSARQTGDLAQEMLAFARGGKYQPKNLNLNKIIQEVLQLQQRNLPNQIDIAQKLAPDLWITEADPTQMSQVMLNLLTNALEAIEDKGSITITTKNLIVDNTYTTHPEQSELAAGPYICCTVQDTGCGMDTETLARVFEPFFTTKFQGRGMGLAAVFGIVKNHGGQIIADSQPDRGSTFKLFLPVTKIEPKELPDHRPSQEPSPSFGIQEQKTILIVEDDPLITKIVRTMLTLMGHQPLVAGNGKEAIEIAQLEKNIDLTLLDLGLPVVKGAEAYPLLMKAQPEMKVIICSGYELDETAQAILDAGANAFIKKPFHLDVLKTEIYKALNS